MLSVLTSSTEQLKRLKGNWLTYFIAVSTSLLSWYAIYHISVLSTGSFTEQSFFKLENPDHHDLNTDIENIVLLPQSQWTEVKHLNFSKSENYVWLKFRPPAAAIGQDALIRVSDPLLDEFVVYFVSETDSDLSISNPISVGDNFSFNNRPLALPNAIVPLPNTKDEYSVYVRGHSDVIINLQMSLWTADDFIHFNDILVLFIGILIGYIFALMCYCIMMYFTTKQHSAIWFAFFLASFIVHVFALSGIGFQFIWTDNYGFQSVSATASGCLTLAILAKFSLSIFKAVPYRFQQFTLALLYIFGVTVVLLLITRAPAVTQFSILLLAISGIVMFLVSIFLAIRGVGVAKVLSLIWGVVFLSVCISVLDRMNVLTIPIEPMFPVIIGFYLQTQIMAVALIYRHKSNIDIESEHKKTAFEEQSAALKAKDEMLELKKNAQVALEKEVKAQTLQLEEALLMLDKTGRELEQKRNIDGLTGLPNRHAFDKTLEKFVEASIKEQSKLGLALIDLDHFKQVNDTFGHMAGDECLKAFAKVLANKFDDPVFKVCRYGGEEFALASIAAPEQTELALHQLKDEVQALRVAYDERIITFTISIGLASVNISNQHETKQILAKADENLYQAKEDGRNLLVSSSN